MEPLSEAGRIFFVATRLYHASLYIFQRLWDEGWLYHIPDAALWRDRLKDVVRFVSQLEALPYEIEPDGAAWLDTIGDTVQLSAAAWAQGDFLFALKGPPEVDPAVFTFRAFLTFVSQVSVSYIGLVTGQRLHQSAYPELFEFYQYEADDCINAFIDAYGDDDNDNHLPVPVAEELSISTLHWTMDWHVTVLELAGVS